MYFAIFIKYKSNETINKIKPGRILAHISYVDFYLVIPTTVVINDLLPISEISLRR